MANAPLTATIIADKALDILDNTLVMPKLVYRGYEEEFRKKVNGYNVGDTIRIRRPNEYKIRTGRVAAVQETVEGYFEMTVGSIAGVDLNFTSQELTLNINELGERCLKPAMVKIANKIDQDCMALYKDLWNWVGTPGEVVNSFADFAKAPQRLDEMGVMPDDRMAVLSPADEYGMLGSQTALFMEDIAEDAYRDSSLGRIARVATYSSQNVPTFTGGDRDNTTPITASDQETTWAASKNSGTMTLSVTGFDASATIAKGDVFTIATVYAINPVTKAALSYLQQFVVVTATQASGGAATLTISPPIIDSSDPAHQTVSNSSGASSALVFVGTASTGYVQNMVFHKNAFALAIVPMEIPTGTTGGTRRTYKGISARLMPYWDGTNDISNWRFDVLYGVKTIDARLGTRLSGTA